MEFRGPKALLNLHGRRLRIHLRMTILSEKELLISANLGSTLDLEFRCIQIRANRRGRGQRFLIPPDCPIPRDPVSKEPRCRGPATHEASFRFIDPR